MPQLRPYAPKDWSPFIALELETQLDSLGDSTEQERQIFKERFIALLDVKRGFSKNGFRPPCAQLWVLAGLQGQALIPLHELPGRLDEVQPGPGAQVVCYCHHGVRSLNAAAILRQAGFANAVSLAGGINLWSQLIDPSVPRY